MNSWVDNDLRKRPKTKCFKENGALQNAIKNRTTKNWVEEDLRKFSMKKRKRKKDTKDSPNVTSL